jgi:apolipoprotein N-acyltransferase
VPLASVTLAALLFTAACPPYGWSVAAWAVPALFLVPLRRLSLRRASALGFLFGGVWGCTMAGWMRSASLAYFDFNQLAGVGFVGAVAFGYAGIPNALLAPAYVWSARRLGPVARPLIGAWLWAVSELLRAHIFTGLPWELLAHTQWTHLPLIQIADLGGAYAVSFLLAYVSLTIGELLADRSTASVPFATTVGRVAPSALLLATTLLYGIRATAHFGDRPHRDAKTVAVVQGNVPNAFRWKSEFFERVLLTYASLTTQVKAAPVDLVVWPENAVNFYLEREAMLRPILDDVAAQAREGLVVGGPRQTDDGASLISAYLLAPDGRVRGIYDKQHLMPFAEYDPLPWRDAPAVVTDSFTPGGPTDLLRTASLRLGTIICYEALFPDLVRDVVQRGANLLVNISNDSWLDDGAGAAPEQHFSMIPFRAIETRRYVVRASASGVSGFVDPSGAVYALLARATEGVSVAQVAPQEGITWYVRYGDRWLWAVGLLLGLLALHRHRFAAASHP